jgi:hypothetical protein
LEALEEQRHSCAENNQNPYDTAFPEGGNIEEYQRVGDDGNEGDSKECAEDPPRDRR